MVHPILLPNTQTEHTPPCGRQHIPDRFIYLISLLLILFSASAPFAEKPPSPEKRYNQAKFYFNQLETSRQLSTDRKNWLKGIKNFQNLYLSQPTSELAPACLYMLARMHHGMYERFHLNEDLQGSITYYKDTARLFADHRLADDSYYSIGLIYLNDLTDPVTAAEYFGRVVGDYPHGDMHPMAGDILKQLSRDHDIPLPEVMIGDSQPSKLSYVLPVKYWSSDEYTRVVVMVSAPVTYREQLHAQPDDRPRRLTIDFHDSYIDPQYRTPVSIEHGLLKHISTAQYSKDTVRVDLDIDAIDNYKIYSLPDPFRVVIDVRGKIMPKRDIAGQPKSLPPKPPVHIDDSPKDVPGNMVVLQDQKKKAAGPRGRSEESVQEVAVSLPPAVNDGQNISLAQQLGLGVKRIVLDPGHGGKDPGATANGLQEKHVVLELAKQLQPLLADDLDCEVILTRDDDTFISLEERTAIANTQGADLFISLHINAHPSPQVRGLETYFLNLSTNAEAMRVAAMENATSTHQLSDLQDILSDIMENSKINESSRLAHQVHQSIIANLADSETFRTINNLGVKQAPFYVLIGAQMPAILIEIAFLSNTEDARNLRSSAFLQALANSIASGVKSYIHINTASLTTSISN